MVIGHEGRFPEIMVKLKGRFSEMVETEKGRGGREGVRDKEARIESKEAEKVVMVLCMPVGVLER